MTSWNGKYKIPTQPHSQVQWEIGATPQKIEKKTEMLIRCTDV